MYCIGSCQNNLQLNAVHHSCPLSSFFICHLIQYSGLFSLFGNEPLTIVIDDHADAIGNGASQQTRLDANQEAFESLIPVDFSTAIEESSIWYESMVPIAPSLLHLNLRLDYVLRVGN